MTIEPPTQQATHTTTERKLPSQQIYQRSSYSLGSGKLDKIALGSDGVHYIFFAANILSDKFPSLFFSDNGNLEIHSFFAEQKDNNVSCDKMWKQLFVLLQDKR